MKRLLIGLLSVAFITVAFSPATFATGEENEPNENSSPSIQNEEYDDPIFTITYNFNGGATYDGKSTYISHSVALAPALNHETLVYCFDYNSELDECHPLDVKKDKELSYVTVNDERHDLGEDDGYMLNQDTTIVYYWSDKELTDYTTEDEAGNTISFSEEDGHTYHLNVNMFSFSMTEEQLAAISVTPEEYETGKAAISGAVSDYGPVIAYFEIEVLDENNASIHQGPFDIKIKYTDALAGYDSYKIIYVEMDDQGNTSIEEAITLTLEDGYLVGTLPHLSGYALVGIINAPGAPDTGSPVNLSTQNTSLSVFIAISSFILATVSLVLKKMK